MTQFDNMILVVNIVTKHPHMRPAQLFEEMKAAGVDDEIARAFTDGMESARRMKAGKLCPTPLN